MPARNVPITIWPSAAVVGLAASGADDARYGEAVRISDSGNRPIQGLVAELDLTAAAKDSGDKLDVALQTMLDGTNWVDVLAFTQCLGNGGAKRHIGKLAAGAALTMFEAATGLAAGSIRDLIGEKLRVKYITTNDADATIDTSFTFSVKVTLL